MEERYFADTDFQKKDLASLVFHEVEFDNCTFSNCHFAEGDFSKARFAECRFTDCNLSMAKLSGASFQDTVFKDCKMLGLRFDDCSAFLFTPSFEQCILDLCSFYKLNLKKIRMIGCSLKEADFTEADLSGALLQDCDLSRAVFDNTNLERADLRGSLHFSIDPARNRIRRAKFSRDSLEGLLDRYELDIS